MRLSEEFEATANEIWATGQVLFRDGTETRSFWGGPFGQYPNEGSVIGFMTLDEFGGNQFLT